MTARFAIIDIVSGEIVFSTMHKKEAEFFMNNTELCVVMEDRFSI